MSHPVITFCGDDALRFVVTDQETRLARVRQLLATDDWCEVVPGRKDISVQFNPHEHTPATAMAHLSHTLSTPAPHLSGTPETIKLPVHFGGADGPDLKDIAAHIGLSDANIIARLLAAPLTVDMLGFTPGFAYMSGLPETFEILRLVQPRQQVPAGSIGLITGQCGLYALAGPGGWPIIGRASVSLFNASSSNPFRLRAGTRVQLVDATES
ncbi:carboxyltransferase domain-containing protein [Hyphomonas sp.]|uniref:5-oxoprolinase subunit B family protein n=1 Tax=Hyphomonas sp. TaxID=87 RepID=UPI0032EE32BF|tara:strand:+ start:72751 stop:73386 length:636 start_codon:yes stop_codon:yes gene_type:complete